MTSQKLSFPLGLFCLKNFNGILSGRKELIACLLFYFVIKMWEFLTWKIFKTYQTSPTVVKIFKQHENATTRPQKKSLTDLQMNTHSFLIPPFLKGEVKVPECWVRQEQYLKKSVMQTKRRGGRQCKGREDDGFFDFHFLTISYHGNLHLMF